MVIMMDKRRRRIDDFSFFEEEFERLREEMEDLIEKMMIDLSPKEDSRKFGIYGISVNIGSDGKPIIRQFGNLKTEGVKEEGFLISDEREPLVDIIEDKTEFRVIAELPGVEKKDIELSGEGNMLVINVKSKDRKYYKELELPGVCDFEAAQATYNNGVLEVIVPKSSKGSSNKKIMIK